MKYTKQFVILVLMLSALGLAANAQSTVLHPYEGMVHTYSWGGLAQGLDYDFYLTANADGSNLLNDDLTGEFEFINNDETGTVGADGQASTQIAWYNGASSNIYYVWIKLTDTSSGCSNYRYVEVSPEMNQFDLLSENIPVDNTISCPAATAADGFNPEASAYTAGYTTLQFKVRRENGTDNRLTALAGDTYDWSFIPQLVVDPDLGLTNVIITIEGANSGVVLANTDNRYTINGLDDEVLVTVSIQNAPGYDLDVNFAVTSQQEHITNLSDSNPSNDNVTHTIQIMPVIDGMGGV